MRSLALALALALACALGAPIGSAGAGPRASGRWPVADPAAARAMLGRLIGHHVGWRDGVLVIDDVAGAGRPWVGTVERRGAALWLVGDGFAWRLRGPLARPRLAGPGYVIWAIGALAGDALVLRRLGVLAPPPR
ncbi:MAG: hypothetical protein IPL61_33220 [Myxococcales bacterium]|nr:hypothetical protein [Myxococcales bacterium]